MNTTMTRLSATLQLDATVQVRNKLYHISIGLVFLLVLLLRLIFPHDILGQVMPAWFLGALGPTTYLFVAGLLLFEKSEHTLDALTITPLRTGEYLLSKVTTLTLLALAESLLTVLLAYGLDFNPLLFLAGAGAMGAIYTLFGIVVVVRYQSISDFLMPSIFYSGLLELPFLHYFGIWETPLLYLWPTHPPLLLMKAAFLPVAPWQIGYGVLGSLLFIGLIAAWSYRAFTHFIIKQERSA
jgi:fluoroquinolone transport system permease protein